MEQLPKPPCLYRRGNRYYLRKRVPTDLIGHYPQTQKGNLITKALSTSDFREACRRLSIELGKLEGDFQAWRRKVKNISPSTKRLLEDLTTNEREAIVQRWLAEQDKQNENEELTLLATASDDKIEEALENLYAEQAYFTQETKTRDFIAGQATAKEVMDINGLKKGKDAKTFLTLAQSLSLGHYKLLERSIKRLHQETLEGLELPFSLTTVKSPYDRTDSSITFGEVCDEYTQEAMKKMRHLSVQAMAAQIKILKQIIPPETRMQALDRKACRNAYDAILQLPKNLTKKYPGTSVFRAINLAKKDSAPLLSAKRQNTYIDRLKAIFKYAENEHYIYKTPMAGLNATIKKSDENRRAAFTPPQLQKLFSAPIYTGCENDESGYMIPGKNQPRRARFWVPLIALFSGMRLEEICQLHVNDITEMDGFHAIQIRLSEGTPDKSIKTESGKRTVPIHPELAKIGLLEYVDNIRKSGQKRLFPELARASNGKLGHGMSKWFRRFLDNLNLKTKQLTFHSFRHTLSAGLKACETPEEVANFLCGWKGKSMYTHYSKGEDIIVVFNYLKKVEYKGLDLRHLYRQSN